MEHLTEILTYLLQRQENGEFSAEKEESDRADRAILREQLGTALQEDGLSDEARLMRIASLLKESRRD